MLELQRSIGNIASRFDLPGPVEISDFSGKGNINHQTYLIVAGSNSTRKEYLLQLLNPNVFTQPSRVMDGMIACIHAQQKALSAGVLHGNQEWETIQLVPTKEGKAFLELWNEEGLKCWRMMKRIPQAHSYRCLGEVSDRTKRFQIAEESGRGLALFRILSSGMDASQIAGSLPGYRDTKLYYDQLDSVLTGSRTLRDAADYLPSDPTVRKNSERHFLIHLNPREYRARLLDRELKRCITLALDQKAFALKLEEKLTNGDLQKVIVHGDTKLENFLFSNATGRVKTLVDLDTIMPHTWLTDWGDLARSLVNITGERETDLEKIEIDPDILRAAARGFIETCGSITPTEASLMIDAAQIMALELGVRFLADYLRGDSYFKLKSGDRHDLNKIRARVQFRVFEDLRKKSASLQPHQSRT